uniref:Uncharacterized protein n=1 Tax=Avena sativa TaxID=4498 RepID=A0ACD5YU20_AVESA
MLPGLIANRHGLHDYAATILAASGHNFKLHGPPATSVRYLLTSSPANVRHIFTTNFANYVKGDELAAVLGILGGTIVAADGDSWRRQRETIHHVLTRPRLLDSLSRRCHNKERRLAQAESVLYSFVAESIQRSMAAGDKAAAINAGSDILSYYVSGDSNPDFLDQNREPTDFLHRTFINFMVAVRDPMGSTLSWLIYNLATNPHAVLGIRKELAPIAACKASGSTADEVVFEPDETKDLVYTRAAMFESLRMYPIAPIERKAAVADDVLPSGHKVRAGDTVLISTYSMGRLEQVWGENCQEYRPERWLSRDGDKLRHVPSHEFIAFNTGPRACLGKNISVALVTSITATVVWNFDVEVLESDAVKPKLSLILQMQNGLMAKVKKRSQGEVPRE